MDYEKLNRLVKASGKTKRHIADACGISRMTLDTILAGGDVRVTTIEAIADCVGFWAGVLFDDPAGMISQTGEQNSIHGGNYKVVESVIPAEFLEMLEARDRQVDRLIAVIERSAALPGNLGKSSASVSDAPANP